MERTAEGIETALQSLDHVNTIDTCQHGGNMKGLFQRTGFLSTQKDGAVHVADDRIRAVFIQGFELALRCLLYTSRCV